MSMTGNEAKGWLEYIGNMNLPYDRSPKSRKLACDTAIKALDEIQQYRAIGTIEEFKELKEKETEILLKDGQLLYQQGVVDGYAKGIDVYVEKLKYNFGNDEELDSWATYDEIAEQLKAGEKNG